MRINERIEDAFSKPDYHGKKKTEPFCTPRSLYRLTREDIRYETIDRAIRMKDSLQDGVLIFFPYCLLRCCLSWPAAALVNQLLRLCILSSVASQISENVNTLRNWSLKTLLEVQ